MYILPRAGTVSYMLQSGGDTATRKESINSIRLSYNYLLSLSASWINIINIGRIKWRN